MRNTGKKLGKETAPNFSVEKEVHFLKSLYVRTWYISLSKLGQADEAQHLLGTFVWVSSSVHTTDRSKDAIPLLHTQVNRFLCRNINLHNTMGSLGTPAT